MRPSATPTADSPAPDQVAGDAWWAVFEECQDPIALVDAQRPSATRANARFRELEERFSAGGQSLTGQLAAALGSSNEQPPVARQVTADDGTELKITAAPSGRRDGRWLVLAAVVGEPDRAPTTIDVVTGIADRGALEADLARRFERGRPFAAMFIDLDGFKQINDTRGHLAGDDALREIAARLTACLRDSDLIARFGGDEFVALVDDAAQEHDLRLIVQRVEEAVAQPLCSIGEPTAVSASVGWALFGDGYRTPREMLIAADHRMYASKRGDSDPQT